MFLEATKMLQRFNVTFQPQPWNPETKADMAAVRQEGATDQCGIGIHGHRESLRDL